VQLEATVQTQLREILRSQQMIEKILPSAVAIDQELDEAKITIALRKLDDIWEFLFPAEQERITKLLIEKVVVSPEDIEVRLRLNGLESVARELLTSTQQQRVGAPA